MTRFMNWWERWWEHLMPPLPPPRATLPPLPSKAVAEAVRQRQILVEERATVMLASIRAANMAGASEVQND